MRFLFAPLICGLMGHVRPPLNAFYWADVHWCGDHYVGFASCERCWGHGPFRHRLTAPEAIAAQAKEAPDGSGL